MHDGVSAACHGGWFKRGVTKAHFNTKHCCETNCYKLVFFHIIGLQRGPCGASPWARVGEWGRGQGNKEALGIHCQPLAGCTATAHLHFTLPSCLKKIITSSFDCLSLILFFYCVGHYLLFLTKWKLFINLKVSREGNSFDLKLKFYEWYHIICLCFSLSLTVNVISSVSGINIYLSITSISSELLVFGSIIGSPCVCMITEVFPVLRLITAGRSEADYNGSIKSGDLTLSLIYSQWL